jgi:acyl dehydratase
VTAVHGADGLVALVGRGLGPSRWVEVTPERFAAATGGAGPGYLALSLTPVVLTEILEISGFSLVVNYGCDRVRFPAAVPAGSRVRGSAVVDEVREIAGGVQATVTLTFEAESAAAPVCEAAILIRYYA